MFIKILLSYILGYLKISVEGFYIERFINICRNQKIAIWNIKKKDEVKVYFNIRTSDFKNVVKIAKKTQSKIKIEQKSLFDLPELSEDEKIIYEALEVEEKCVDEIQSYTKLSIDNLLMYLTMMELKGIIKQVDGDRYKRVNPVNCS